MLLMALHLISLFAVFSISSSLATPLPLQVSQEGSADGEDTGNLVLSPSPAATSHLSSEYQTTPGGHTHVDTVFLNQVVEFLQKNLLFIIVGCTLILVTFFTICGVVFMSHRRKVSAYYPSSFPSKMYVDQRDKTGGAKPFSEVPEKPLHGQESEAVDSSKQLQAEIMRATKSLRTPNKSLDLQEGNDPSQKTAKHSPEDSPKTSGSILEKELPNHLEQKELCQLSDNEAAVTSSPKPPLIPPEQACPEDDSDRPPSGPGLSGAPQDDRFTSQHIHSDSATLQLVTGEKTAF